MTPPNQPLLGCWDHMFTFMLICNPLLCKFPATPRPATQKPIDEYSMSMTDILAVFEELSKVCEGPDDHVIVCKPSYHKILRESYICPCDSLGRFI